MKKQLILVFILAIATAAHAQKEFRVAKSTGWLKLNLKGVIIEGYEGKEIVFSSKVAAPSETDERAKGMVVVTSSGYTDNTGLGISVTESGTDVHVVQVGKHQAGVLTIKVPQTMKVSMTESNMSSFGLFDTMEDSAQVVVRNLKSEIEISTSRLNIKLDNNTGPMSVKTVYGSVEGTFTSEVKGPVSIISVFNLVDIGLPATNKANLELGSTYGKIYVTKELSIDYNREVTEADDNRARSGSINVSTGGSPARPVTISGSSSGGASTISINPQGNVYASMANTGEKVSGKLNGGGADLILKSTYKNVYLRKR